MKRFFFGILCRILGMGSFRRHTLPLLLVALVAAPVHADGVAIGFVASTGHRFIGNGVWQLGSSFFTRSQRVVYQTVNHAGYGCSAGYSTTTPYYVWQYDPTNYTPPAAAVKLTPPAYSPDWKSETLKYVAARDDLLAYQQTLATLGIRGQSLNYGLQGFGTGYGSTFQASGDTQFGYSYRTVQNQYGALDLNALNQQVGRNVETALKLGAQANADHAALAAQFGDGAARVAEINARAALIRDAMRLNPSTTTTTYGSGAGTLPGALNLNAQRPMPQAEASADQTKVVAAFGATVSGRCFSCHSNAKQEGKLNMADWYSFDEAKKDLVRKRIELPPQDAKHMPRDEKGAGVVMSDAEKALFYQQ